MENKNSRAWPSSSIIFSFLCSKHPPHNRLALRKTHFLPEAAKILIKTQRSVQQLPRCMSSNGNTRGRQRGRSAACNSLTEEEERRRARGDSGFHKGQREWERGDGWQDERWRKTWGVRRINRTDRAAALHCDFQVRIINKTMQITSFARHCSPLNERAKCLIGFVFVCARLCE